MQDVLGQEQLLCRGRSWCQPGDCSSKRPSCWDTPFLDTSCAVVSSLFTKFCCRQQVPRSTCAPVLSALRLLRSIAVAPSRCRALFVPGLAFLFLLQHLN
jgi:hypothetical protein